ncbi:ATP11 protein-domain-containing protein [Chytridium lagenaria]|nr:ATP11 protein-domain-containing protein [Chytridium lagenaria]
MRAVHAPESLPVSHPDSKDYLEKYQQKLQRQAQKEGLSDVEQLIKKHEESRKRMMDEKIQKWKEKEALALYKKAQQEKGGQTGEAKITTDPTPGLQGLHKVMKVDLLEKETAERISEIWNNFYFTKDGFISGAMSSDFYKTFKQRAAQYPFFVLPLPRESGYEFFFMQIYKSNVFFTPLLEYKTKQENARPHLVLTHFDELADSKKMVLMNGEIVSKVLTADDAKLLVYLLQMFYVTGSERKKALVEKFHKTPEGFNFQEVLDEADRID